MITSARCSRPSLLTTESPRTSRAPALTTSTLGADTAGYQSLEISMRLQPSSKFGVSRSRSAGSATCRRSWCNAALVAIRRTRGETMIFHSTRSRSRWARRRTSRCSRWRGRVEPPLEPGRRTVRARQNPRRRPLQHRHPLHQRLDLGNELDRRGAGTDDHDVAPGQIEAVVPAGRVEHLTGETIQTRQVRDRRIGDRATGVDEHVGADRHRRWSRSATGARRRPTPPATGCSRNGCGAKARARTRPGAGSRGSRAGWERPGSSARWAQTTTSTDSTGCRRRTPDRCCPARHRRPPARAPARETLHLGL